MSDLQHRPGNVWRDAEALVERVEQAARSNSIPREFYDDLVNGLRLTTRASSVSLTLADAKHCSVLARSGVVLHADDPRVDRESNSLQRDAAESDNYSAHSRWLDCESGTRLVAFERLQSDRCLQMDLQFDGDVEFSLREPLGDLTEVLLDLTAPVVMREELSELRSRVDTRQDRDGLIRHLNEGVGLTDSFASIAATVAPASGLDRVSLLHCRGTRYRLIATSTQQKIERRARQVRLLERLVEIALRNRSEFNYRVGTEVELDSDLSDALESYFHQSGSREISIRSVSDEERGASVAAFVLEQFHGSVDGEDRVEAKVGTLRQPLEEAIRGAVRREDAGWGFLVSRMTSSHNRKVLLWVGVALAAIVLAACFIPVELKLPAEGRLVATEQRRLFAPVDGIVAEIPVQNGQSVLEGELLVLLRSPPLELERRTVEGNLATSRTRLASLMAMRSRGSSTGRRDSETMVAADEQVIRQEIEGLESQLELLKQQQADLSVVSPLEGTVDRWDLQQSLQSRPVTHGQYLLDVLSEHEGWTVELDIPEKNVNYVLDEHRDEPCICEFRLRSDPTAVFDGVIEDVSDVAHLDATGQSMVRATFEMDAQIDAELRAGATVIAQVHCGKYPLGFVGLRSLVEWYRSSHWF
ncbi:MAG: biotin/lipoyl-binding protein [Rubripirellula sp.]